jgi:hypothetical protein
MHTIDRFISLQKRAVHISSALLLGSALFGSVLVVRGHGLGGNSGLGVLACGLVAFVAVMLVFIYRARRRAAGALARGEGVLLRWRNGEGETVVGAAALFCDGDLIRYDREMRIKDVELSRDRHRLRFEFRQTRFSGYRQHQSRTVFIPPELAAEAEKALVILQKRRNY